MATTVGASSSRRAGRSVGIAATVEDDACELRRQQLDHYLLLQRCVGREEHPAHAATDEFLLDAAGVAEGGVQTSQKVAHGAKIGRGLPPSERRNTKAKRFVTPA